MSFVTGISVKSVIITHDTRKERKRKAITFIKESPKYKNDVIEELVSQEKD